MTQQRAQYLLDNPAGFDLRWAVQSPLRQPPFYTGEARSNPIHNDGITLQEYLFVAGVWVCIGEGTCFQDALEQIARGL